MTEAAGSSLLQIRAVTKRFGGITAVKTLTMDVTRGALYGLIGPNDGARIDGKKPYEITRLGIARTFQNIRLFPDLTVLENVMAARHLRTRQTLADAILGTARHHREEGETRDRSLKLLKLFDLDRVADERSTSLPYGSQRRLEIARALATSKPAIVIGERGPAYGADDLYTRMAIHSLNALSVKSWRV